MKIARVATLLAAVLLSAPACALEEGKPAPVLELRMLNGETYSLADAKGQVVVINFWASWCGPCRHEMPALDAYYRKHRNEGLKVFAVSVDDPFAESEARQFMAPFSIPVVMAHDASFSGYGRIWHVPMSFVIDRKGILRKNGWYGTAGLSEADLEQVVTPLLRQR